MEYLFDDDWFYVAKQHVINTITKEEYQMYKSGRIRRIYESFEHMVLDNIEYYDRIIRTIVWLYENKLVVKGKMVDSIKKSPFKIPMTPTVFYYIVLMPIDATIEELYLAFPSLKDNIGQTFVELFKPLSKINAFKMNIAFCKQMYKTKKYAEQLELDKTSSSYLNKIMTNINDDVVAVTKNGLTKSLQDIVVLNKQMVDMYNLIDSDLDKRNSEYCNVKPTKVMLFSRNAEYECTFTDGRIIRQSVRNWEQCFKFDKVCSKYLDSIYKWIDKSSPDYTSDLVQLMNLCVVKYMHKAIAIRKSQNTKVWSKCTFKKCWGWWLIREETFFEDICIKKQDYHVTEQNIGRTLVRNGYYVIGHVQDQEWLKNIAQSDDIEKLLSIYQLWLEQLDKNRQTLLIQYRYNRDCILNYLLPYIF